MIESLARELCCPGTGLTTEAKLPSRVGIAFHEESLRRLVGERLGAPV